ncbi:hypothetical protein GCM10027299_26700 [Larkinella ripae]
MGIPEFLAQLNCSGAGCISTTAVFPEPDAVSGAYPSPLTPDEQAGIYAPGNPPIRGYDESYAVVVGGNFTVPSGGGREVEGRLAVGGNLVINQSGYGISQSGGGTFVLGEGGSGFPVAVGGTISGSGSLGVGFNRGGTYTIRSGGANTLPSSGAGSAGQTSSQGPAGIDIAGIISGMQQISSNLCTSTPTGSRSGSVLTGTNAANEVFTIANSSVTSDLTFSNIAPGATVVVNVTGGGGLSVNWRALIGRAGQPGASEPDAQVYNVIFNFCEATSVSFNSAFIGTALVPNGSVTLNGAYDGRLYVSGDLTHAGTSAEIHNYPFTGSFTPTQLPVTLAYFQARGSLDQVELGWQTRSEINFSRFVIEYGPNAKSWESIGSVNAVGSPFEGKRYHFTHAPLQPGTHYYRLKLIDVDGSYEYSKIQGVVLDGTPRLVVMPNPADNQFSLTGLENPDGQPIRVRVVAPDGRLLKQYKRPASERLEFTMDPSWPKGLLLIQVEVGSGKAQTIKLLKQ